MRALPVEIQNQLALRQGIVVRNFVWIKAKNRTTGALEEMGLWNGDDHQTFVVNGVNRTYYAAGAFVGLDQLRQHTGLQIRALTANLSPIAPELDVLLRQYNTRFAPVEIHQGFFSTETNNLLAPLERVFKGWVNKFQHKKGAKNASGTASIALVGHTRLLTKKASVKRSHETQLLRQPGDTFFRWVSITGTIQTAWGSKNV